MTRLAQLHAISLYCPWSSPNERALRQRLHRAHGAAVTHAGRSIHSRARRLYWEAADIASSLVFARIPEADLREAIEKLAMLFMLAGWVERTEAPDAE